MRGDRTISSSAQTDQSEPNSNTRLMQQALTPGKPIATIINPSGTLRVRAEEEGELRVTVSNQGNKSALIDISIDEQDTAKQWFISSHERLALNSGQSSEVLLKLKVPKEIIPRSYDYLLVVDAPQHYPQETPIYYPGKIQVLPFVKEALTFSEPSFSVQPTTTSEAPMKVQPGETVEVQVWVDNRSERVDRFRLTCPDFKDDWYKVSYPEGFQETGLIVATDGLELNPGDHGAISLQITPPLNTRAGVYSPTIRLYSENNSQLVLLDIFYLQVTGIDLLDIEMLTQLGRVKNEAGLFKLQLHNRGNRERKIALKADSTDGDQLCTYTLEPEEVEILPDERKLVSLKVQPPKSWWRRPFYGRLFNFAVEVEDKEQLPLVNNRFQGALMWEARPWWQFWLLVLSVLGIIGAMAFLIWWSFFRPKPSPEIVEFSPESIAYQEAN
ncbi:MAG: transcriptional regulator, partial [Moorea sp. SIO2B7]|nr:transcriptional regulator [Moorena sp. SIO2B7]